ncbi:GIY-YIG nuclease family protein [Patescibacteria group bacterium]|nr:GIY-YIG nuclease family protein [Patescibacteria group bacterium]MBU1951315.1 GIY-YIG nuclease family protein [Patescibacteria group bacterium]
MRDTHHYTYIMTNIRHTVLYTGMTSNLVKRIESHKEKVIEKSFTARYNLNKLVYFEQCSTRQQALEREKQIKAGSRKKKESLINKMNPEWEDLSGLLF